LIESWRQILFIISAFLIICLLQLYSLAYAGDPVNVELRNSEGTRQDTVRLYKGSYALLIGVSRYTAGWSSLESVPAELTKVEEVLREQGFVVEKCMDPDSEGLTAAFTDFVNRYGYDPDNRLLFYFSGHGHTRKDGSKGYLVPTDAPNPFREERVFLQKALGMNHILSWARDIEAKHAIFLFDSCFSGTIFKQKASPEPPKYITLLTAEPVRQFITAGTAGESVPAKSVFTPVFIDALRNGLGDLNKDGYVSGTELGLYLQENLPKYTDQSPQFGKIKDYELSRGDFVFLIGSHGEGDDQVGSQNGPPQQQVTAPSSTVTLVGDGLDSNDKKSNSAKRTVVGGPGFVHPDSRQPSDDDEGGGFIRRKK